MESDLPDLATVSATLIAFAEGSGASSVTIALDQGDDFSPVVVSLDPIAECLEVSEGEESRTVPDLSALGDGAALGPMHLHSFPPFEVDLDSGEIIGVIGGLDHLGKSVLELARLFGGNSVASASFPTVDGPGLDIGASASGEVAVSCGDTDFETPAGWPGL